MADDDESSEWQESSSDDKPNHTFDFDSQASIKNMHFIRLLKIAINEIKQETAQISSLRKIAEHMKISALHLRQIIETLIESTKDIDFKTELVEILIENDKQGLSASYSQTEYKKNNFIKHKFRAGEWLKCKLIAIEPGGYSVIILDHQFQGFLPTEARLKIGDEIKAQYGCVHNNRILLSARMS